ncbi:uncharacterized protein [Elaeis guineensis]|uniref:uncharacterized protein isoform X2 n=1 Tax=Elaeis guineensis var. tenera TaxID=51953 RepID=UPI003C6CD74E
MSSRASRTVYVGNLPGDIREREVEDLFYKYGPIIDIDLKIPPRPPGYAFIEFEDARDAEDAIYGRDGYNFDGHRLRVELAHGGRGYSSSVDRYSSYSRGGVSRRSEYRVLVTGLPSSASWQDLKDHMRRAGDVCFSEVFRDGRGTSGIVDYTNYDDMKYAVREYDRRRSLSRSRSRSYSRSRSPSHSHSYGRSSSHSRSNSPKGRSAHRSFSRSRSRSVSSRSRSGSREHSLSGFCVYRTRVTCFILLGKDDNLSENRTSRKVTDKHLSKPYRVFCSYNIKCLQPKNAVPGRTTLYGACRTILMGNRDSSDMENGTCRFRGRKERKRGKEMKRKREEEKEGGGSVRGPPTGRRGCRAV